MNRVDCGHWTSPLHRLPILRPPRVLLFSLLLAALGGCTTPGHTPAREAMRASPDPSGDMVQLWEGDHPILLYHARAFTPWPSLDAIAEGNRIYARPRADYIDPLYGPSGERLTRDGPVDHPHHRGIYWAWPEVMYRNELGDLHALQRIFAHPEGQPRRFSLRDACGFEAVQLWKWEHQQPIVREHVRVVAYRSRDRGRTVDLEFRFEGLADGVSIARRETRHYGGLNVRMETPKEQRIETHTDPPGTSPRRAWSDLSGRFLPDRLSGLTVLQHPENPNYPGDWVQYPDLSWCQPTFPAAGTRWPLPRGGPPLTLRYRLWIHEGGTPSVEEAAAHWEDFVHARP